MKKILTAFLIATLSLSTLFSLNEVEASTNYKDVPTKHWAYNTIQEATKLGYFKGDGKGNFNPKANVTRAEFAQILARLFDGTDRTKEPFTDVADTFWGKDAIEEMLALGIINANDYANKRFEPNKAMTRTELSKWLTNALSVEQPTYTTIAKTIRDSEHTLLPVTEYLKGGISKAEQGYIGVTLGTGLFGGYTDGSFKPKGNTSRAEVATLAIRFRNMQDKAPTEFNGLNEIVEVSETATNMLAATKFEYANYQGEHTVKSIVNKPLTLNNNIGTFKIKRLIFIEGNKTVKETLNNSIYAKMFIDENNELNNEFIYENSVHMYVDQTLVPNKKIENGLTIGSGSTNGFVVPFRLADNVSKYNLATLQDYSTFFKVGKETRYWTQTSYIKKSDFNYGSYKVDDGTVLRFYSTY